MKYWGTTEGCVDTTMSSLQATVFFSNNRAVFNGSVFARGACRCFPMLDHEERWKASISSSSYQWVLARSNQGGFVPLCVSLCRWYRFSLCSALLCCQHLLLRFFLDFDMLFPDCLWRCSVHWKKHCSISGTNTSVTVVELICVVMSLVFIGTPRNK